MKTVLRWHEIRNHARKTNHQTEPVYFQDDKSNPTRRNVLVVDDEPSVRDSLDRLLRLEGYGVATASHGTAAIEVLQTGTIHIVLLDVNLGPENGWDLCHHIRQMAPDLPVIIITARDGVAPRALAAGARACLQKPLSVSGLLAQIRQELVPPVKAEHHEVLAEPLQTTLCSGHNAQ